MSTTFVKNKDRNKIDEIFAFEKKNHKADCYSLYRIATMLDEVTIVKASFQNTSGYEVSEEHLKQIHSVYKLLPALADSCAFSGCALSEKVENHGI